MCQTTFQVEDHPVARILRLQSDDGTNRLTSVCVLALIDAIHGLSKDKRALVITGNNKFFSSGAELEEITALKGASGYKFSKMGQALMTAVECFPAAVYAAISGYCMGGGLDLVLACQRRIATPNAVFGHRGAALGLITGWGGTQRLPRLIGKARALELFVAAKKLSATAALQMGLIDAIAPNPVSEALRRIQL